MEGEMQGTLYTSCSFNKYGYCYVNLDLEVTPETEAEGRDLRINPDASAKALIAIRCPKALRASTYFQEYRLRLVTWKMDGNTWKFAYEFEGGANQPKELQRLVALGLAQETPLDLPEAHTN